MGNPRKKPALPQQPADRQPLRKPASSPDVTGNVQGGDTSRAADSVAASQYPFARLPVEFGRYRIERLLGSGAMGTVYLAEDIRLGRLVALKIPKLSNSGSDKLLRRLETEARSLARIDTPHICRVFDFGEYGGVSFIAMEYVPGEDLQAILKRTGRKRSPKEAVRMIIQLAEALAVAHESGVIHRDLKPANIRRHDDGRLVIMDFGLARQTQIEADAERTLGGTILGSAAYMSPEQAGGHIQEVDERSDIYALGVILFELLTGEWPFQGSTLEILGQKSILPPPNPLTLAPELPPELATICQKMIARNKRDRSAHCSALVRELKLVTFRTAPSALRSALARRGRTAASVSRNDDLSKQGAVIIAGMDALGNIPSLSVQRLASAARKLRLPPIKVLWLGSIVAAVLAVVLIAGVFSQTGKEISQIEFEAPLTSSVPHSEAPQNSSPGTHEDSPSPTADPLPERPVNRSVLEGSYAGESRTLNAPLGLKLIWCPPGSFRMGSPFNEPGRKSHERQVDVTLTQGFWLGGTEVTQGQWRAVMGTSPWKGQSHTREGDYFPASYVNWWDAMAFCQNLTEEERRAGRLSLDQEYTLPTEAQWEYACRAGSTALYSFGNNPDRLGEYAWFHKNTWDVGERYAHPVGAKQANVWGLHDMHGNVREWCLDSWSNDLPGGRDPLVYSVPDGVHRGGSWYTSALMCRSAMRYKDGNGYRMDNLGFRVALCSPQLTTARTAEPATTASALP